MAELCLWQTFVVPRTSNDECGLPHVTDVHVLVSLHMRMASVREYNALSFFLAQRWFRSALKNWTLPQLSNEG